MAAARSLPRRVGLGGSALAAAATAFAIAGNQKLPAAAILALATMVPFVLYSPATATLAWLITGPVLGGSLAVMPGRGLPAITVDRVILAFLAGVVLLRWLRDPSRYLRPGRVEVLMAIFLVVAAVSALAARASSGGTGEGTLRTDFISLAQSYATPFLGYVLGKNLITDTRQRQRLLWLITGIGVTIALVAVVHHYTGSTFLRPTRYEVTHEGRATGTLSSAPHFGLILALSLFPAIFLLLRCRTLRAGLLLAGAIGVMLLAIYLGKTRATYVGLLVGLGATSFFDRRVKRLVIALLLTIALVLVVGWSAVIESEFVQQRILDPYPIYNRVALAATAVNMIVHNPVFGIGFGTGSFAAHRAEYLTGVAGVAREYAVYSNPHNDYLEILVLLGIVGFVPYCGILIVSLRSCVRNLRACSAAQPVDRAVALVALASITCYLEQGLFGGLSSVWYASNIAYLLLGVAERQRIGPRPSPAPAGTD